jgi:hypothetical protein
VIRDVVFESLNNANANGYGEEIDSFTPEELASDMVSCTGLGAYTWEQILPFVLEWLEIKKIMGRVI